MHIFVYFFPLPSLFGLEQGKLPFSIGWFASNEWIIGPFPQVDLHEDVQPYKIHQIGLIVSAIGFVYRFWQ